MLRRRVCVLAVALVSLHCAGPEQGGRAGNREQGQAAEAGPRFELCLAQTAAGPGLIPASVDGGPPIFIADEPLVTIEDVIDAEMVRSDDARSVQIRLDFRSSAGDRLAAATKEHIGRPLAILIDGRVASAPALTAPLGNSIVISGSFEEEEVAAKVDEFRAAAKRNRSKGPLLCRVWGWC